MEPIRRAILGIDHNGGAVFVKICGITSEEDALLAVAMGADAIGFVFAPSPRRISPDLARDIARRLPGDALTVGVFRDERPERVAEVVNRAGLKGAQLHGHEPVSAIRYVRDRVGFVIRGLPAGHPDLHEAASVADIVLIDSNTPGSGRVFDWSLSEGAPDGVRLMLAGGLTPANVGEAIRAVRPWGVDTSTGVESSSGKKDARKLLQFIETAKRVGEEMATDGLAPDLSGRGSGSPDLRDSDFRNSDFRNSDPAQKVGPPSKARPYDWELDE